MQRAVRARWVVWSWGVFALACTAGEGDPAAGTDTDASGTEAGTSTDDDAHSDEASVSASTGSGTNATSDGSSDTTDGDTAATEGDTEDTDGPRTVCDRWNLDRADLSEGTWSGDVGTCSPGDVSANGRERALRMVNLYRWLAGLPPVSTDPQRDARAQACALMMHANGSLSHNPPPSWTCYTEDGAMAAGSSNISPTPGVAAIDLYMVDPGNDTTLGHRRWILSNTLGPTGLGSTDQFSCMWTVGGTNDAGSPWTAWPPPGEFPVEAVAPSWTSIDETGWSVQSDTIDLDGAQVEVTADAQSLPVVVTPLLGGYGSASAISIVPQGWVTQAGTTYHVHVTGISQPIEYVVEVVSCT